MKRMITMGALAFAIGLLASPMFAKGARQKSESSKPAPSASQVVLAQWNNIGRKLIAMAEDFPENKYEFKTTPPQRSFAEQLLHVAASMYYFTDVVQGQKPRYPDDPKRDELKTKAQVVAFVKKCVADGAATIKAKGDKGMSEWLTDPDSKQQMQVSDMAYSLIEHSGNTTDSWLRTTVCRD
jgi:uncharacterized damage-inducible protein DinB